MKNSNLKRTNFMRLSSILFSYSNSFLELRYANQLNRVIYFANVFLSHSRWFFIPPRFSYSRLVFSSSRIWLNKCLLPSYLGLYNTITVGNFVLALRGSCLTFFVCIYILLGFLILYIGLPPLFYRYISNIGVFNPP